MRSVLVIFVLTLAVAHPAAAQAPAPNKPSSADTQLRVLYEAEWAWQQKEFARRADDGPFSAQSDHLPRVDPATQARRLAYWGTTLAALNAIKADQLSHEEQINAAVFRTTLEALLANQRFRTYEAPFNSDSQFWTSLAARSPYNTAEAYRHYLGRLSDVPRYFDEQIANMRAGLARGFSVPRATLEGRDATIVAYTEASPVQNPFYAAFRDMPAAIPAAEQEQLRAQARQLIADKVVPAYNKLLAFFRGEYPATDAHDPRGGGDARRKGLLPGTDQAVHDQRSER